MIIRLLLLAILAITVLGHRIEIDPGEKQCFFEALQPQDKVSAPVKVWAVAHGEGQTADELAVVRQSCDRDISSKVRDKG